VHKLTSESMDRDLTVVERARVHVHLLVCNACRNFTDQMDLIRKAMRRLVPDGDKDRDAQ
jgi:predicted anti-sigma-YlaC factor YlaD